MDGYELQWKPVFSPNGNIMINGNNIVVQNIISKDIGYMENNRESRRLLNILEESEVDCADNFEDTNEYLQESERSILSEILSDQQNNEHNMEGETQTTKIKWTHKLTKYLIQKRLSKEKDFARPKCKKIKLWQEIAKEINVTFKVNTNAEECDNKYRNLLKTYKVNVNKKKSSGESAITWEYFNDFDEVLGYKASITPPSDVLFDTIESSESTIEPANIELDKEQNMEEASSPICTPSSSFKSNPKRVLSKNTLKFSEYLFLKNKREEEKKEKRQIFEEKKWDEEKELRQNEIHAILKLADAISKKSAQVTSQKTATI